jgi:hypothetical protein
MLYIQLKSLQNYAHVNTCTTVPLAPSSTPHDVVVKTPSKWHKYTRFELGDIL